MYVEGVWQCVCEEEAACMYVCEGDRECVCRYVRVRGSVYDRV